MPLVPRRRVIARREEHAAAEFALIDAANLATNAAARVIVNRCARVG
jgi:hypothetical protein